MGNEAEIVKFGVNGARAQENLLAVIHLFTACGKHLESAQTYVPELEPELSTIRSNLLDVVDSLQSCNRVISTKLDILLEDDDG